MLIQARRLLDFTTEQLWDILNHQFELEFDDGQIVQTNARQTLFSHMTWDILRDYPDIPLLPKHLLTSILPFSSKSHILLLQNVAWDVINRYYQTPGFETERIAKKVCDTSGYMYNTLICKCSQYPMSADFTDYLEIVLYPPIAKILATACADQKVIEKGNAAIAAILTDPKHLPNNQLARIIRMGVVSMSQVLQIIGMGKSITDIDSYIFPRPISENYFLGYYDPYNAHIDSRSTAKSLYFAGEPLEDSEYFARRLAQACSVIEHLVIGDCGTEGLLRFQVRNKKDLKHAAGMYFVSEETGALEMLKESDSQYIGNVLHMRNPVKCKWLSKHMVCSTCLGELSKSVPKDTNIGAAAAGELNSKATQNVMSTKHDDAGASLKDFELNYAASLFLSVGEDGSSYFLKMPDSKTDRLYLVIDKEEFVGITDVREVEDVFELAEHRVSDITAVAFASVIDGEESRIIADISVDNRNATVTYDLMRHIKKHGWEITDEGAYKIDITDYPTTVPLLNLSRKHFNMAAHSKQVAAHIESSTKDLKFRGAISIDAKLTELYDFVVTKVDINFAWLSVIMCSAICADANAEDYRIPSYPHKRMLGVASLAMTHRSLSAKMAYQGQHDALFDPRSFFGHHRESHPFDVFVAPDQYTTYHGMT